MMPDINDVIEAQNKEVQDQREMMEGFIRQLGDLKCVQFVDVRSNTESSHAHTPTQHDTTTQDNTHTHACIRTYALTHSHARAHTHSDANFSQLLDRRTF